MEKKIDGGAPRKKSKYVGGSTKKGGGVGEKRKDVVGGGSRPVSQME